MYLARISFFRAASGIVFRMSEQKSETAKREEHILAFWNEKKIFEKSLAKDAPKGEYVFYDGPPFATGLPHHGSLLSSIIKDVIPRYQTMRGYRVRRRWGWDCHGLPIESLVEKELGLKTKKDIEKIGVKVFNEKARAMVLQFVHDWEKYVERVGRWVDFKNSYKTMDNTYIESVWWALKQLWDKNLLYEGNKVLMYCTHCETPLAKAEIAMDNTYKDITEEAVTVKFKIKNPEKIGLSGDVYLLAWTTTPWTLPGNVGLAVGGGVRYSFEEKNGAKLISVRRGVQEATALKDQNDLGSFDWAITGKQMAEAGIEYEPLFDVPALKSDTSYKVYAANFVSTEEGTGIVHTAVMYGEDDFALGQKEGLPMVQLLNADGTYNDKAPEALRGKYIKQAEKEIKVDLEKRGLMFERKNHTHSYPHCYRCGTPLIYNAVSSWFLNIQKVKAKLLSENEKVNWVPEHLKHGRFQHIVENAPDWTISRNRFWASPLPIWKCVSCGKIDVVGSIAELKEKAQEPVSTDIDLHRPYVDEFTFACECGGVKKRVAEVVDCWVESGSMPFAEYHYPFENKGEFEKRAPGDFIAEYIAQTRTWFYYMHAMGVLLFDRLAFRNVVSTGTILASDGEKISKSKRNYTDPIELIDRYGSDALRFYLMSSTVMQAEDVRFRDEDVRDAHNRIVGMLWNCYKFYDLYKTEYDGLTKASDSVHVLDRWILARLAELVREVTNAFEAYDLPRATRQVREFVEDYSQWYVRRSRERVKEDSFDKQSALATQREVLLTISRLIAPVMPFLAESVWQGVGGEGKSVHLAGWPEAGSVDEKILADMAEARRIVSLALEARDAAKIRVRQPLSKLEVKNPLAPELLEVIRDEVNVKEVVVNANVANDVALDTTLTDELREEGMLRDIIREIQGFRKTSGLKPGEQGTYSVARSAENAAFIEKHKTQLEKETNTEIRFEKLLDL